MEVARVETAECVELARAPNVVDAVSILYFLLLDGLFVELRRNLFGLDDPQQSQVVERRPQNGECHAHLEAVVNEHLDICPRVFKRAV